MPKTRFGPGTVTYTIDAGTPVAFQQEVKGGGVAHEYADVGEDTTYLDGSVDPAGRARTDKLTLDCDFDLGSAGFYAFLQSNDLATATVEYTPHTTTAAKWAGQVVLTLPDEVKADEWAAKHSGTVEHTFIGSATFTPGA